MLQPRASKFFGIGSNGYPYAIVSSDGIFCVLGSHKTITFASYINLTSYRTAQIIFVCFLLRIRDDFQVRIWIQQIRKTTKIISKMFY